MNNKKLALLGVLVVGLVVGISLIFNHTSPSMSADTQSIAGGDIRNPGDVAPAGIGFGSPRVTTVNWAGDKISAKTNTAFWKNTTGKTQYVTYTELSSDNTGSAATGAASSTYLFYAYATTTAPRTLYDLQVVPTGNASTTMLINGVILATTTVATTTSSLDNTALNMHQVVVQPNGEINFLVTQRYTSVNCAPTGGTLCETATSSNRGFNLQWRIQYHD